jgi:very-short-patch-repair endonuclease
MDNDLNKSLLTRRELRNNSTPEEAVLWTQIKSRKIKGYKWRRQHPIGSYILDFYCPEAKLCIELDGAAHYTYNGAREDNIRTSFLNSKGIKVIRFENRLIWDNIDYVLEIIELELENKQRGNLEF